ncbi:MAG: SDR family NAD(P)-dependent oxidoreductase [Alphaproteobacteria bacterium]|nr:SDR family NAD(P)-dependent oxidoreductase [Alphaproteobacteria bacterium]
MVRGIAAAVRQGSGQMPGRYRMALITGATSGIGAAFAAALPRETGLLLTGRDAARLEAEAGRRALIALAETLPIDLLINNAGFGAFGPCLENDRGTELGMVAVNVTAVVELTHALLPAMIERARGQGGRAGLIVVSSTVAFVPMPMMATYAATKTFELSFTEALAEELRDAPVDVLVFCPGATRTGFFQRARMPDGFLRYAEEPAAVAPKALAALGRQRVQVSRGSVGLALSTIAVPRRIVAAGARRFIQRIAGHGDS